MRLENRLLINILLPLLSFLIIAGLILRSYYNDLLNRHADEMLHSEAEVLKERIENRIKETSSDLALLLANEAVANYFMYSDLGLLDQAEDMRWLIEKTFLRAGNEKPEYFGIRLIRADGRSVIDIIAGKISYTHYDFSDMGWFKETISLAGGDTNISEPCLCREFGKPTITVSRLYIDEMGRRKGMISVDIHMAELFDKLVPKEMGDGYAYLISDDGLIMAHTDKTMIGKSIKNNKGMTDDTVGVKSVYIHLGLRGLHLVVARSMEELSSLGNRIRLFNIIFSISTISVVILVVTLIVRNFTKPLAQITDVMDEIRKGRFDVRMEVDVKGKNELANLSSAFNSMALALKERELSLRESEARYRTLFEMDNDAIYLIDPETYRIVDCNKKAGELLGYRLDEIKQMDFKDIHAPDEFDLVLQRLEEVKNSRLPITIPEHHHITKGREMVDVEASISIIGVMGKEFIISIVRDITERKKKDDEIKRRIRELEEFYEIAVGRELKMKELREELEKKEEELRQLRERYKK
ncbi:MAG: hypothetical protein Fur0020_05100 [Thermodesulfovibrionia bacterium]